MMISTPSDLLDEIPIIKDRLIRKANQSRLTYVQGRYLEKKG